MIDHRSHTHNLSSCEIAPCEQSFFSLFCELKAYTMYTKHFVLYRKKTLCLQGGEIEALKKNDTFSGFNFTNAYVVCIIAMINHVFIW